MANNENFIATLYIIHYSIYTIFKLCKFKLYNNYNNKLPIF